MLLINERPYALCPQIGINVLISISSFFEKNDEKEGFLQPVENLGLGFTQVDDRMAKVAEKGPGNPTISTTSQEMRLKGSQH